MGILEVPISKEPWCCAAMVVETGVELTAGLGSATDVIWLTGTGSGPADVDTGIAVAVSGPDGPFSVSDAFAVISVRTVIAPIVPFAPIVPIMPCTPPVFCDMRGAPAALGEAA
jgi:hypothetical protein